MLRRGNVLAQMAMETQVLVLEAQVQPTMQCSEHMVTK